MIVLGTGGHAIEILDTLSNNHLDNLHFYDIYKNRQLSSFCGFPIINSDVDLKKVLSSDANFILGTGDSFLRETLYTRAELLGGNPFSVVAASAIIGKYNVKINQGCNIMTFAFISSNVQLGKGTLVNSRVNVHHDVIIGNFCELCPSSVILGNVRIGNNVLVGSGAIILPGIQIGNNAVIGAGSLVTKDVESFNVVKGIPAKNVK
jgi:sugar O-acyltransferase (sialic acid O-acetyltransferase NeuD family)